MRAFQDTETRVEPTAHGFAMALPLMYPDGMQVVVNLEQAAPRDVILSDGGRTLGALHEMGLHLDGGGRRTQELLAERLRTFELRQEGFNLLRAVRLPLQGVDIQIFAEAIVSIAHLQYRIERAQPAKQGAMAAVHQILDARKVFYRTNAPLDGRVEKAIRVDYLLGQASQLALQVISRRGPVRDYMEQWGWRWTDIRNQNPGILRGMVYDPDSQEWDHTSLSIGREVCDVFCPYTERAELNAALDRVA